MKKLTLSAILLLAFCTLAYPNNSETISIPDPHFKKYMVKHFDLNGDGEIDRDEALKVEYININFTINPKKDNFSDFTGIEHLENLKTAWIYSNIKAIDISNNLKLEDLTICSDNLESINTETNLNLKAIRLRPLNYNNIKQNFNSINLSNNSLLEEIEISNAEIRHIDISHNPALKTLILTKIPVDSIDFTANENIECIAISQLPLKEITLELPKLKHLTINDSYLNKINVRKCPELRRLETKNNFLKHIEIINPLLTYFDCSDNKIKSLNLYWSPNLETLECSDNKIYSLDITSNKQLKELSFRTNYIRSIDLSKHLLLEKLDCGQNMLSKLNISNNIKLIDLWCSRNNLSELDVTNNLNLQRLGCSFNNLSEIVISLNKKLTYLDCSSNNITALRLPGLKLLDGVYCGNMPLEELVIRNCPNIRNLACEGTKLTTIDISKLPKLKQVRVNQIPHLSKVFLTKEQLEKHKTSENPLELIHTYHKSIKLEVVDK